MADDTFFRGFQPTSTTGKGKSASPGADAFHMPGIGGGSANQQPPGTREKLNLSGDSFNAGTNGLHSGQTYKVYKHNNFGEERRKRKHDTILMKIFIVFLACFFLYRIVRYFW